MARWEEALDAQLDLVTYANSEAGRTYARGWAASFGGRSQMASQLADRLADRIVAVAFNADPFWVDPDMQTLWEAATPSFEPEPLHPQDLLVPMGFVYLPRPFHWKDIHGRTTTFRAILWHEVSMSYTTYVLGQPQANDGTGLVIMTFHRMGDVDDYDDGRQVAVGVDEWRDYADVGARRGQLQIDHIMPWAYGAQYYAGLLDPQEQADHRINPLAVQKPMQCLWRLMQQTIATRSAARPGGQFRRRWERAKMPERDVVVIRLRRPTPPPHEVDHRQVEWTHRWLVAGHWRNQWYPSIGLHRQIWISPYVKGDASLPLEVRKAHVFAFVR